MGLFRPTIVFSQSLLRSCNDSQLRSVIAHELAHLKHCDLVWSLLPAVVHLLLYFHPLVWLARDRFRLASELAADEAAILKVADAVAGYGESLLRIALLGRDAVRRGVFPCEVAAVHTSSALRTRLYAMKTFSICSTPRACIFAGLLGLLGILGLAPIQFVPRLLAAPPEEEVNSFGQNLDFELTTEEGLAKHWGGGGSGYALTLDDDNPHAGATCGWIAGGADQGFGTFTQCLDPGELVGKRIAFRGYLRSDLRGTGGLWMRVDAEDNTVSFDNMQDRPVTGKTGWSQYTIVLDVPLEATRICFGFLMSGKGSLWGDGFEIELLGPSGEGPAVTGVESLNFWGVF